MFQPMNVRFSETFRDGSVVVGQALKIFQGHHSEPWKVIFIFEAIFNEPLKMLLKYRQNGDFLVYLSILVFFFLRFSAKVTLKPWPSIFFSIPCLFSLLRFIIFLAFLCSLCAFPFFKDFKGSVQREIFAFCRVSLVFWGGGKKANGYLRKSLLTPQITRNHPKPQIFLKNPALPRNPPGIPTEFILSALQNPTEFHWVPLNLSEISQISTTSPKFHRIPEISAKSGEERNSRNQPKGKG